MGFKEIRDERKRKNAEMNVIVSNVMTTVQDVIILIKKVFSENSANALDYKESINELRMACEDTIKEAGDLITILPVVNEDN
jgi:hypothetical protein